MWKDIQHQGGTLKAFGMDLSKSALSVKGSFWASLPFFVLLLLMIGTQYYQQRQLTSRNPQASQGQQAQIMRFFPIMFGVISIRFPAGVVVYWTVSNIIRIFQQWAMYRYDPKVKALVEADVREVEERTREIEGKPATGRPRFRDLLSGAANTGSTDPKTGKPGAGKSGGVKPPGRPAGQRGGKTPPGAKTPPSAKLPLKGKMTPPAAKSKPAAKAKPAPPAAKIVPTSDRPGPNGSDKNGRNDGGRTGSVGTGGTSDAAPSAGRRPSNGAPQAGIGGDDVPPETSSPDATGAKNGTPGSRTGAGGAKTGGNRGKRNRRGR
jgi:60Kd inner membrane protein